MNADKRYMRVALSLAGKAQGMTSPNPSVGAVIVRGGRIVGKGYHKRCGLPHAEPVALKDAGRAARGATMYVTLEPCDHFGRTPPCTDAIIGSGIKRVVIAMKDPNPFTDGRGIKKLRAHGIKTTLGVLRDEAAAINRPFIKCMTKKMPYVTVKLAQSIDGKIATRTGDSKWITSDDSRAFVQKLRRSADAVMVGVNTVIRDDPALLPRQVRRRPGKPVRIVVDSRLRTPLDSRIMRSVRDAAVLIVTTDKVSARKAAAYVIKGASVLFAKSKGGMVDLKDMMRKIAKMRITDVLVEGGGELAAGLVDERLADRFIFFIAPKIIGGRSAVTSVEGRGIGMVKKAFPLADLKIRRFAEDIMIEAEAPCLPA